MDRKSWITQIAPYAVTDMMQSKVLASITVAQCCLESADGNHAPGNNYFGEKSEVKGQGQLLWTQEFIGGKWVQVQDWFRVYPDLQGSITDHSAFLTVNSRYARAGLFTACNNLDYRAAAQDLQAAGYATDPKYAASLIKIIEDNQLYLFDKEAFQTLQAIVDLQKDVAALKLLTKGLVKTSAPAWFITEFGAHALDGIVTDLTGDEDFWRDTAVVLRMNK